MALTRREIAARYRARHLERERARLRACSKKFHAENREKSLAATKAYRAKHRDRLKAQGRERWAQRSQAERDKDKQRRLAARAKDNASRRAKRAANPEAIRAREAARRQTPEYRAAAFARTEAWRRKHPEWASALSRKVDAKRRAIEREVFIEAVDPRVVFDRDRGVCGICKEAVDPMSRWEVDHVIPIAKGGPHAYANVQLAHRRCNRAKGARLVA